MMNIIEVVTTEVYDIKLWIFIVCMPMFIRKVFLQFKKEKGKHMGEVDIDLNPIPNSIDKSGGHDINVK